MRVREFIAALSAMNPELEVVASTWDRFMYPAELKEWGEGEVAVVPVAPKRDVDPEAEIPMVCFEDGELLDLDPDTWILFGQLTLIFRSDGTLQIDPSVLDVRLGWEIEYGIHNAAPTSGTSEPGDLR